MCICRCVYIHIYECYVYACLHVSVSMSTCVWHDSFICVTWLIHMWDMTHLLLCMYMSTCLCRHNIHIYVYTHTHTHTHTWTSHSVSISWHTRIYMSTCLCFHVCVAITFCFHVVTYTISWHTPVRDIHHFVTYTYIHVYMSLFGNRMLCPHTRGNRDI